MLVERVDNAATLQKQLNIYKNFINAANHKDHKHAAMARRAPISEGQMRCKVKVDKYQLAYFRRLARNTTMEIEAYLVGEVVSPELVRIDRFVYTSKYADQSPTTAQWYKEDFDKVRKQAEDQGLQIVGSIHSHPCWVTEPSSTDYKSHIQYGSRILGICATKDRHTKATFWVQESCLPCKIIYAESEK